MKSDKTAAAIEVSNLRKNFGALEVLKGISFEAHEGDVISILGPSGSGKSTMLRCINMLEVPTAGQIRIFGEEIKTTTRRKQLVPADNRQIDRMRTDARELDTEVDPDGVPFKTVKYDLELGG